LYACLQRVLTRGSLLHCSVTDVGRDRASTTHPAFRRIIFTCASITIDAARLRLIVRAVCYLFYLLYFFPLKALYPPLSPFLACNTLPAAVHILLRLTMFRRLIRSCYNVCRMVVHRVSDVTPAFNTLTADIIPRRTGCTTPYLFLNLWLWHYQHACVTALGWFFLQLLRVRASMAFAADGTDTAATLLRWRMYHRQGMGG